LSLHRKHNAGAWQTFPAVEPNDAGVLLAHRRQQAPLQRNNVPERNFYEMINFAQTQAATWDRLYQRWDCTLIVEVDSRRSWIKFRPQPVWNFNPEHPLTLSPGRRTVRPGSRLL